MSFRPREDLALEEGERELKKIIRVITEDLKLMNEGVKGQHIKKLHAQLSDLDGRIMYLGKCSEEVGLFRKKIQETFRLLPKQTTDASIGTVSDAVSDEVPDDIIQNTGEVKVIQYFVFLLTNSSNGLYVGSEDSLKGTTRCSYIGGGINCKPSDVITYKKLLGPFDSQAKAQQALCQSITETRYFPLGIGLKGKWQGGNTWYGLWNASVDGCSPR
jgi:hypothetical protein